MAGFFITESEIEKYLEMETRDIAMPDGSTRPITSFRLMWRGYDYILETSHTVTAEKLVEWAIASSKEMGYSFEDSFPNMVAYVHRALRKRQGVD